MREGGGARPVYTVCNESRYLIVRNIPALGCIDELINVFKQYGPIEDYRPMDEVDSDPYEDVCWIKFANISNARFAKRKLDEYLFFGNLLKVAYAPEYESFVDVKEKLEERRHVVLNKINPSKSHISRPSLLQQIPKMGPVNQDLLPTSGNQQSRIESVSATWGQFDTTYSQSLAQKQCYGSSSVAKVAQSVRLKLDQISNLGVHETTITVPGNTVSKTCEGTDGRAEVMNKHVNKKYRLDNSNRRRI